MPCAPAIAQAGRARLAIGRVGQPLVRCAFSKMSWPNSGISSAVLVLLKAITSARLRTAIGAGLVRR